MDPLVPEVISLISKLGAMMVLIKAGFMGTIMGRKTGTLTAHQHYYNDVHGWYRARIEQLFARLWHWGLVRNIWRGGPNELHQSVRILLHFTQFCIRRQVRHPPLRTMGPCSAYGLDRPKQLGRHARLGRG